MEKENLLRKITQQYLTSPDFNGLSVSTLGSTDIERLKSLVSDGLVTIVFGDIHPNPHIRALKDEPVDVTLAKMASKSVRHSCAYPTKKYLTTLVKEADYTKKPYAYELALGNAQLEHRAFNIVILESYRNDPRYSYRVDDIRGMIYVKDGQNVPLEDDAYLRFGFAFDEEGDTYVAVFLWDLFKLSSETQQQWQMREVTLPTILHPDYHRAAMGHFPERLSLYEAFVMELKTINEMSDAMGRPHLFRQTFYNAKPRAFAMLLRPTLNEYNNFIHTLDKMVSDNINIKFFQGEVEHVREVDLGEGRFRVEPKGSIQLLEEWVNQKFSPRDPEPLTEMFATFRQIRKMRNKPAHSDVEDKFEKALIREQRELMVRTYTAVRLLRLLFGNIPATKAVKIDDALREGKIWTY